MSHADLKLEIITQEKPLLSSVITSLTTMTESGEVTILPGHIGLFTRLKPGLLRYLENGHPHLVAVYGGFMDVSPEGIVTILADAADRAEDLDLGQIQAAKTKAQDVLHDKHATPEDFALAETALRQIYLKERAARSHRTGTKQNV